MAKPLLQHGYTMLANEIVDAFARLSLSNNEWRVLWVIIRKTDGYHKEVDKIANSQIIEATGLHESVVSRSIKKLHAANIVSKSGKVLGLQKDYELWFGLAKNLTESSRKAGENLTESSRKAGENLTESSSKKSGKLTESSRKLDGCAVTQKKKESTKRFTGVNRCRIKDPRIKEIFDVIEQKLGQQIPFYGKEGAAVKRALAMDFTPEQIIDCWETMRGYKFWTGKWLPLHKVTENLPLFVKGELKDGDAKKARRVAGGRPLSDYERGF